jgi:hypothetical protein
LCQKSGRGPPGPPPRNPCTLRRRPIARIARPCCPGPAWAPMVSRHWGPPRACHRVPYCEYGDPSTQCRLHKPKKHTVKARVSQFLSVPGVGALLRTKNRDTNPRPRLRLCATAPRPDGMGTRALSSAWRQARAGKSDRERRSLYFYSRTAISRSTAQGKT